MPLGEFSDFSCIFPNMKFSPSSSSKTWQVTMHEELLLVSPSAKS